MFLKVQYIKNYQCSKVYSKGKIDHKICNAMEDIQVTDADEILTGQEQKICNYIVSVSLTFQLNIPH